MLASGLKRVDDESAQYRKCTLIMKLKFVLPVHNKAAV